MRLIFMGSPEFAAPTLEAILDAGHEVAAVYCQPPRPAGRGARERRVPVHAQAVERGLEVRHPADFRDPAERAAFAALKADAAVVAAYGLLLPPEMLGAPARGCLNIHASLLPRWRGAAPVQRAIMAGDSRTGVCIMQMAEGLDAGPVLLRADTPIEDGETAGELGGRLARMGAALMVDALGRLDGLAPEPQDAAAATHAAKIRKDEAAIDWNRPAAEVDRRIRGLSPAPGAWTEIAGRRVRLLASRPAAGGGAAGEVLDDGPTIACAEGAVRILRLQREGKQAQHAAEFLRGTPLPAGTILPSAPQRGAADGLRPPSAAP